MSNGLPDGWVVNSGDILFSWAGVANSINIHKYNGEKALINQHIYNFKFKTKEIKEWSYQIIKNLLPELKQSIEGGTGQLQLTKPFIQKISIPFPTEQERSAIAKCLMSIDQSIDVKVLRLYKYKNQKKSLMTDLLTGRVRVKI